MKILLTILAGLIVGSGWMGTYMALDKPIIEPVDNLGIGEGTISRLNQWTSSSTLNALVTRVADTDVWMGNATITVAQICLTGDTCETTWPAGGGGGGGATSTLEIDGVDQGNIEVLDFNGTDFFIVESPAGDFDITASTSIARVSQLHNAVTLAGEDYLSLATQQITANAIDPDNLSASDFGSFTCNGTTCTIDSSAISNAMLANSSVSYGGVSVALGASDATPAFALADATGLPISTGVSGLASGIATFLGTPSSANLDTAVTDDTGSGALVFGTSPTFTTSALSPIFSSTAGDPSDAGVLRLGNAESVCWEASPASTDVCLSVSSSEIFTMTNGLTVTGTVGATTITGANVTSGANPGHTHTGSSLSGIDVSDDVNLTAGRSLTLTGDDVLADAELYTNTKCIWFENPTSADDFKSIWRNSTANDVTITEMWGESDQNVAFDFQVDDGTPADVNGTDINPIAGEAEDTSLSGDTTLAVNEELDLAITSVASTPTYLSACWTFTWND